MCREIQLGVASANLAVEHAKLDPNSLKKDRFGVEFGANLMLSPPEVLKDGCWKCVDDGRSRSPVSSRTLGVDGREPRPAQRHAGTRTVMASQVSAQHAGVPHQHRPGRPRPQQFDDDGRCLRESWRWRKRCGSSAGAGPMRWSPAARARGCIPSNPSTPACGRTSPSPTSPPMPGAGRSTGTATARSSPRPRVRSSWKTKPTPKTAARAILAEVLGAGSSCVIDPARKTGPPPSACARHAKCARRCGAGPERHRAHQRARARYPRPAMPPKLPPFWMSSAKPIPMCRSRALKSYFGNSGSGNGLLELAGSILALREGVDSAHAKL